MLRNLLQQEKVKPHGCFVYVCVKFAGRSVVNMSTPFSKAAAHDTAPNNPTPSGTSEDPGTSADNTTSDSTQDNTNDSYFLPGTPPSKKVR